MLSAKSLNRLAYLASTTRIEFLSIMTLTYPSHYPNDGKTVKGDLNRFLTAFKREYGKLSYLWFLEFQVRGAPHFHILLSIKQPGAQGRYKMGTLWAKAMQIDKWETDGLGLPSAEFIRHQVVAVHTHPKSWENVRKPNGARKYALKYATKPHQKQVPELYQNVGRFWGNSRDVPNDEVVFMSGSETQLREFLDRLGRNLDHLDVLPKHIWTLDNWMPED